MVHSFVKRVRGLRIFFWVVVEEDGISFLHLFPGTDITLETLLNGGAELLPRVSFREILGEVSGAPSSYEQYPGSEKKKREKKRRNQENNENDWE